MASQCKPLGAVQNLPKQRRNKNNHYCSADKLRKINLIHYFFRCFRLLKQKLRMQGAPHTQSSKAVSEEELRSRNSLCIKTSQQSEQRKVPDLALEKG